MANESTSSSVVVRSYQPSDLPECQAIFTEAYRSYDTPMAYINFSLQTDMADIDKNYLQVPNGHWWVAVSSDDNRVLGHVAALPLHLADPSYYSQVPVEQRDHICELRRMAVASNTQRLGVGSKLVSTLIDFAREKGYRQIHLTTLCSMKKACAFYEKYGFVKGRIEKFSLEKVALDNPEDLLKLFHNLPKPIIFEADTIIPDEDQRLMNMPVGQSKFLYAQHYSLMV
jgi:ribosomal protein S18 acetylase RimI-like enzyme